MTRHWSFVVCDRKYLFPAAAILLLIGAYLAVRLQQPEQVNRVGNFVIGIGVWMSMRYTLREGINRTKSGIDSAVIPGTGQPNVEYFNRIAYSIGDAHAQINGFVLVLVGSVAASYGDLILKALLPGQFTH